MYHFIGGMMKEDLLMVNFYPKLEENATSTIGEYIFVIDRSGMITYQTFRLGYCNTLP